MLASGFSNAPVTRALVFYVVVSSLAVSLADIKYLIPLEVSTHIWTYRQFWRFLTWQASYINSTEVLFAVASLYHLRVVERLWGPRKFATFLVLTAPYTTLLPPLLLTLFIRPLSLNRIEYLPAGPTALLFALLAQYYAAVPYVYKYRLLASRSLNDNDSATPDTNTSGNENTTRNQSPTSTSSPLAITLTSKTLSYLLPIQLGLSQLPGSAVAAAIGWAVGLAYRNEILPYSASGWRIPAWIVGERENVAALSGSEGGAATSGASTGANGRPNGSAGTGAGFEGLRRRLEGEAAAVASTTGSTGAGAGAGAGGQVGQGAAAAEGQGTHQRRTLGGAILESFRAG